ncbi:MAG TPA: rod-binding protein [Alphaproteobacteria bacterium]|nr:rod-binding protein [Alphaproteobacteria bacterium]
MNAHPAVPSFLLAKPGSAGMPSIANATNLTPAQSKARDAAVKFESVFLQQMLQHMFKGVKTDGPFGGGQSEKIYRSMATEYYADAIAKRGGVGIADAVYSEILKLQHQGGSHGKADAAASVAAKAQTLLNAQFQGQAASQELK